MSRYTLTIDSTNAKTGGMPVSTSSKDTCPSHCPFKGHGCYAEEGPMRFHWEKVSNGERGSLIGDFCWKVRTKITEGTIWRHNQMGDLPGVNDDICVPDLMGIISANSGKKGFTYTHKTIGFENLRWINFANQNGFTINLSANNQKHADELVNIGAGPVSLVVPSWECRKQFNTPEGNTILMCPSSMEEDTNCIKCGWCQKQNRSFIVGVKAHGSGVVKVDRIIEKERLLKLF